MLRVGIVLRCLGGDDRSISFLAGFPLASQNATVTSEKLPYSCIDMLVDYAHRD